MDTLLVAVFSSEEQNMKTEILGELQELARTAGYYVTENVVQNLDYPDPRHYLGKGKVDFAKRMIEAFGVSLAITRHELSPSQAMNLERLLGIPVIDRTQLILEIFAEHATTKEGKLEVELASLKYQLPRLKGFGRMLSQTGAGIGTRGPGEKKLEIDRRQAQDRISRLRKEIEELAKRREISRKKRQSSSVPLVSFVGYTNVGKSSLVSEISSEDLVIEDKLFATLDTRVRKAKLPAGMQLLVSDTVGFIRELPHELMESFKSTLDEVKYSDILVVVSDASDMAIKDKYSVVDRTLREIGAGEIRRIHVLNKIDLCTNERLAELEGFFPDSVMVSALRSYNIEGILNEITRKLFGEKSRRTLRLTPAEFSNFMRFRNSVEVLSESFDRELIEIEYLSSDEINERLISSICEEGRK
ncbi:MULTISPECIES: GTPase HflX [Mesotoga]|uniref:GTPase HflX n=1 Tax=Mesotoga TaxID=1184396 RepID=UPI00217E6A8B|nr:MULTISPECIES: GTPase HflX [Mesotoga]HRX64710.1 GTPase HflX [Mesotoga sp.]HNQ70084.1 GTPase HflX [Mesotoga prima]HNS74877.1 GTPase HflX [Mesotoga prima]HOP37122.1 GTPase HflX [Mesotoga prima]HOZ98982.1 GTPase HflX [Mesotoga prima]